MKQPYSLATQTFWLSYLSMCAVLAVGRIKEGLKLNLKRTEQQLDQSEAEYHRRNIELIGSLSENASLKAGMARDQTNSASRDECAARLRTSYARWHGASIMNFLSL